MTKIILHIGYPKTATTWFQNNFYPNILNYTFFNRREFREKLLLPDIDFVNYVLEQTANNNYIICEEKILGTNNKNLSYIKKTEKLFKAFPNTSIIIFIRNQLDIIASSYSYYIRSGGTMSPVELILFFFISGKIKRWDYYNYLKPYIDIFGKEKINLFFYEDFNTDYNNFIANYISKFGFDINKTILNNKINKSYPLFILKAARFTNKFSKTQVNFKRPDETNYMHIPYLHNFSHKLYSKINVGRNFNLEKDINKFIYNKLYNYFVDGNKKLMKEFDLDLKIYNYPL